MKVGYARVSTDEQTANLQVDALRHAGCVRIYQDDGISGSIEHRPALDQALRSLTPGDILVAWKLDRLGRSLSHLIKLIAALDKRGIAFRSISEAIDTTTAGGRLQFHIMGALAEFERALISERTKAGLAAARSRGAALGRPGKLTPTQVASAATLVKSSSVRAVADHYGVTPPTLRRALAKRT